ncbi:MAG: iron-regulated protein [Chloroflexi bacterium]|nr:iron-regulated protein [Chloroflexota bacterium]
MQRKWQRTLIVIPGLALCLALAAIACTSEPAPPPAAMMEEPKVDVDALKVEVVAHYANGVHGLYSQSLASARVMDATIGAFLADPNPASLEAAKRAWLRARDDYGPTEVFRFYGGPIDNEEDGPEGLTNAWPMDESYIDYVEGNATAGIINMPNEYPTIDADLIVSLNEEGGEENVSTGWHAIEFLLWGQDLNDDGPGDRPFTDYTTNDNADRRGQYLAVASDTLIGHMQDMVDAWAPGGGNYRAEFLAMPADDALVDIITGAGALSQGELAGERINVAYEERSQEDEHSCFSDNTVADIVGNAIGVRMVLTGDYGVVSGPGIIDLFAAEDEALAQQLANETRMAVNMAHNIPDPFDQHLTDTASDSAFGRTQVKGTIDALNKQAETIVAGAAAFGYQINTSV